MDGGVRQKGREEGVQSYKEIPFESWTDDSIRKKQVTRSSLLVSFKSLHLCARMGRRRKTSPVKSQCDRRGVIPGGTPEKGEGWNMWVMTRTKGRISTVG